MERVTVRAYGKLNIGLDITGKREDGYHLLKTVMQTVNIYDEIVVSKRKKGIMLSLDRPFLPNDERNLAFKAARMVSDRYREVKGAQIEIQKRIPVGGGMAGGSTDAAGVINALDRLYDLHMEQEEKDEIAVSIGADVPFCLRKGLYYAEGIGEKLTKLPELPEMTVVICAPGFSVSTAKAYQDYDDAKEQYHPDTDRLLQAIRDRDRQRICAAMGNSLEPVVEQEHGLIRTLRNQLEEAGALRAMMSGSGSTVFGLFEEEKTAEAAKAVIVRETECEDVFITGFVKGE